MNPEAKVMDAIRNIIKRQPLERPIEEYGLYLPPETEQGQEVGAWLPDSETIAKCNIAQVSPSFFNSPFLEESILKFCMYVGKTSSSCTATASYHNQLRGWPHKGRVDGYQPPRLSSR